MGRAAESYAHNFVIKNAWVLNMPKASFTSLLLLFELLK